MIEQQVKTLRKVNGGEGENYMKNHLQNWKVGTMSISWRTIILEWHDWDNKLPNSLFW